MTANEVEQLGMMGGYAIVPHREGWIAWAIGDYREDCYAFTPADALMVLVQTLNGLRVS